MTGEPLRLIDELTCTFLPYLNAPFPVIVPPVMLNSPFTHTPPPVPFLPVASLPETTAPVPNVRLG